jgi:hypothetical protein
MQYSKNINGNAIENVQGVDSVTHNEFAIRKKSIVATIHIFRNELVMSYRIDLPTPDQNKVCSRAG